MGLFSWTCAKSHLPILAGVSWPDEFCRVVALLDDGSKLWGSYDGYGRVDGNDLPFDQVDGGKTKLVLQRFYRGESFAELGPSQPDPGQGHFHDETLIRQWYRQGGFPTYQEYLAAYCTP